MEHVRNSVEELLNADPRNEEGDLINDGSTSVLGRHDGRSRPRVKEGRVGLIYTFQLFWGGPVVSDPHYLVGLSAPLCRLSATYSTLPGFDTEYEDQLRGSTW